MAGATPVEKEQKIEYSSVHYETSVVAAVFLYRFLVILILLSLTAITY